MATLYGVVLLILAIAGCGSQLPAPTLSPEPPSPTAALTPRVSSPSPEPAFPADHWRLRLAVVTWSGTPLQGATFSIAPFFSLYEDGDAIYTKPGQPWQNGLFHAHLNREQRDALIADALDLGGLSTAREMYDDARTDTSVYNFEITDPRYRAITVYGLGVNDADLPSAADRAKFKWLVDRLSDFDADIRAGKAEALGDYRPEYRVWLTKPYEGLHANAAWPWTDLTTGDFTVLPMTVAPSSIVTPEQAQKVIDLGIETNLIVRGTDGAEYQVIIRPMLPIDEMTSF